MLLLIDNYDSFTYNLVQVLGDLARAASCIATTRSRPTRRGARLHASSIAGALHAQRGRRVDRVSSVRRPARCRSWASASATRRSARCSAARSCARRSRSTASCIGMAHKGQSVFEDVPSPLPGDGCHSLIIGGHAFPKDLEVTAETGHPSWACTTGACPFTACSSIPEHRLGARPQDPGELPQDRRRTSLAAEQEEGGVGERPQGGGERP